MRQSSIQQLIVTMAATKTFFLVVAIIGLAMVSVSQGAQSCDSCPQCIIISPICATYDSKYATNNRRVFLSECHMNCYNRCHNTNYYKISSGSNC